MRLGHLRLCVALVLIGGLCFTALGCGTGTVTLPTAVPIVATGLAPTRPATATPIAPTITSRPAMPTPTASAVSGALREVVIIHTNDEHGALLPIESRDFVEGGAAYAAASWMGRGYVSTAAKGNVLLISGGDNFTGPALSTWFRGESTIEVMNAMGYRASVLGNHEFDYGQDVLLQRIEQARFSYLAANMYRRGTQQVPDFARPYVVIEINGVKVGVVGLANRNTPTLTAAKNVEGLSFGDYEPALRRWVPIARTEGAQVVVVAAHVCPEELRALAGKVRDLGIAFFAGGHCHQSQVNTSDGALIAASSEDWQDYILVRLVYDLQAGKLVSARHELISVLSPKGSPQARPEVSIAQIIAKWEERSKTVLGDVIGYTRTGLAQHSQEMHSLLVASWLWAYPNAQIAVSNKGGFRQGIAPGDIKIGDVVSVFPFENEIYELEVLGKDIAQALEKAGDELVVAGLKRDKAGNLLLAHDGSPLKPDARYRLLVTDFLYGNQQFPFRLYDKEPYTTSISWRQPVIDWVRAQRSDRDKPIEKAIAAQFLK